MALVEVRPFLSLSVLEGTIRAEGERDGREGESRDCEEAESREREQAERERSNT